MNLTTHVRSQHGPCQSCVKKKNQASYTKNKNWALLDLNFRRRIKSRLPFAGIISSLSYSTRFEEKG